ncbi:hypothetical protein HZH68_005552 [Vespula germanica]|uniref:Uncharacterized protein n=1 Tax=Vespula germanica TaxID=30212 RepID=A0A834KGB8_VESGE|nr:hypothetical protein HZH68_005552 [Vespula germanica]
MRKAFCAACCVAFTSIPSTNAVAAYLTDDMPRDSRLQSHGIACSLIKDMKELVSLDNGLSDKINSHDF